jgi:hypothetical protein
MTTFTSNFFGKNIRYKRLVILKKVNVLYILGLKTSQCCKYRYWCNGAVYVVYSVVKRSLSLNYCAFMHVNQDIQKFWYSLVIKNMLISIKFSAFLSKPSLGVFFIYNEPSCASVTDSKVN